MAESQSNIWTHIISLHREDAARLGYDSAEDWMNLLRSKRNMIAKQMRIKPENFRWYAAFHDAGHHPHVHMMAYSIAPKPTCLLCGEAGLGTVNSIPIPNDPYANGGSYAAQSTNGFEADACTDKHQHRR